MTREVEEARRELRGATDLYRQLRREIDRLQPELAEQFAAEDRLLWDAEAHFPGGQLQLLAHEVDAGLNVFGSLNKLEQYARLKVWIGRFRFYQASQDREAEPTEELQALSHQRFPPAQVPITAVRAWLHRGVPPGLSRPTGRRTSPRPRSNCCRRSRPAAASVMPRLIRSAIASRA